jgi:hypothetical protein
MLFYGRRRRGFPWLLAAVFIAVFVLALLFAFPGGDSLSRFAIGAFVGLLLAGTAAAIVVGAFLPRRRR